MAEKKQIPLRLSAKLYEAIAAWAEDDFRSVNGQIEYLLTECVRQRKKNGGYVSKEMDMPPDLSFLEGELLDYYGGGCIHFCGRSDHLVPALCEIDSLYAIQASQPHLNDMNAVLAHLRAGGKKILMLPDAKRYIEEYTAAGNGYPPLEAGMIHS